MVVTLFKWLPVATPARLVKRFDTDDTFVRKTDRPPADQKSASIGELGSYWSFMSIAGCIATESSGASGPIFPHGKESASALGQCSEIAVGKLRASASKELRF
jgi:hypothetical protein